ncbi:hypothetical protein HZF02_32850 (plasmid) [Pseudomonas yamanorum]|nr:hypothetical protein HZF02_32850 [Pseudomonas yamanorum]
MSDLSQTGALSPIDRARLSAELLQIRASLSGTSLSPIERVRSSARGLAIRAQLGHPAKPGAEEGQAAFEKARQFYQENLKGQLIQSVVGPVSVNSTGWKKSKQGMKSDLLKARLIEHVREILETGTAGQRQEPHKDRNDGFVAFYFIQKQVRVDDLLVTAGVTVAEDAKGNLFYSISHADRDAWKAYKNGAPDYAGVGPRSGNADDGMLDGLPQVQESDTDQDTVADDDINITILAVVAVESSAVPAQAPTGAQAMATGVLPQKNGGVLVMGDPQAMDAYAKTYLDQAKYTLAPTGLLLSKSQVRLAQYLPTTQEVLPSGAVIYTYAEIGGVSVAVGRELSGIARDLPELKSLVAQEWGPDKFKRVFGEDAAAKDVQVYQDGQAAIAQRKQDNIDEAVQAQADQLLAQEQEQARVAAEVEETAKILAQRDADARANFAKTIGVGKSENPIYQAYLDTLEELPTYEAGNSGFLGWAGIRVGEFERQGGGRVSMNHDAYLAYVRDWADKHLSDRVKAQPANVAHVEPAEVDQSPVPATTAHEIIEYTTKGKGKVLRGIIRTDLTQAEAKAIDPYTWRLNGGYFIREKYLSDDTSAVQAAPAPVVLSPEQEAEKQDRDRRVALERQQEAISHQVGKLREAGNKAIASGSDGMNADRKTNTSRRAGMAASAYARAAADEAEGQTLNNIADAIEVGAAGPLANLTSRAQLQELKKALSQAKYESERGLTYSDQLALRGQPVGEEALRHVSMPNRLVWSSRYSSAAMTLAKKAPTGNSKLIAALKKLGDRTERWPLVNDGDIAITRKAYQVLGTVKEAWDLKDPMEMLARVERLKRMGITNDVQLQDACRALLPHMAAKKEESAVVKLERSIIGQKVGIDFFPTPVAEAHRMARLARITKGMRVLEPSAGNGNLADAAAAAGGEVDVIEISSQLRDILTAKGYTAVAHDFTSFTPDEPYQAILMNPPFSKRQDAEHIMRAYGMLASGGTLVAIAGEGVFFGQDQKAVQFRAWLDTHNADVEKLGEGTFQDNALLAQTSVNARLIVMHK